MITKKINKKNIISRTFIQDLKSNLLKQIPSDDSNQIILDFSQVYFISRSVADELLNMMDEIANQNIEIKFANISPELERFLSVVRKSKQKIRQVLNTA